MTIHRFVVKGLASPDLPLRVLNLFAQQDLAFDRVAIVREGNRYTVTIEHHDLTPEKAGILLEKMRVMVLVESAEMQAMSEGRTTARPSKSHGCADG